MCLEANNRRDGKLIGNCLADFEGKIKIPVVIHLLGHYDACVTAKKEILGYDYHLFFLAGNEFGVNSAIAIQPCFSGSAFIIGGTAVHFLPLSSDTRREFCCNVSGSCQTVSSYVRIALVL
ncbi:hypothetical protein HPP92_019007 [Vanilla planifolia]|uniref:Uncharacterized protein n=1 Tax=Vanilla planifolia TaxID=51239 RepID=A0A835UKJ8_VANPL|nr:hypothetical protein HPP92_019007 [Vanilla planifolia]